MKKMLINARQSEETRIAVISGSQLTDLSIESVEKEQKKSNIYKARISRIEISLNAVFVNYGEDKNGFLPFKEIAPEYFKKGDDSQNMPLNDLLDIGQELIVQISKEERGSKGAALTTFITLAGCYMVLMPNNPDAGGISRRVEGDERQKLKILLDSLKIPKSMGIIIRTAGVGRSAKEIQTDLDTLVKLWNAIKVCSYQSKSPFLIHKESNITIRAIRDHLREDIKEIVVDDRECYEDLKHQLSMLCPHFVERLELYKKDLPIFSEFQVERQIESAFKREVQLPSGGSIIIDITEAMTAIDINSARSTKADNIEETALATNLEAADEISKQLRLRDIGGLIVIDFIDMAFFPHQKAVEQKLINALLNDRARIQMTRISKFGLVEISRQRLQASLGESVMRSCQACSGNGFVRSVPSLALSILRNIHAEASREKTNELRIQLPVEVGTFLLNEKRNALSKIESATNTKLTLIPNINLRSQDYNVQRIWGDLYKASRQSYDLIEDKKEVEIYKSPKQNKLSQANLKPSHYSSRPLNKTVEKGSTEDSKSDKKVCRNKLWKRVIDFFCRKKAKCRDNEKEHPDNQKKLKLVSKSRYKRERRMTKSGEYNHHNSYQKNLFINNEKQDSDYKSYSSAGNRDNRTNKKQYADNKLISSQKYNEGGNYYNKPGNSVQQGNMNRADRNNRSDRAEKTIRNNGSRGNINSRQNQRLQVHQSGELVDISFLKEKTPDALKAAKKKAVMKTISIRPEEKISTMVIRVLAESTTLPDDKATQVETCHPVKKWGEGSKYLKFEEINTGMLSAKDSKRLKRDGEELTGHNIQDKKIRSTANEFNTQGSQEEIVNKSRDQKDRKKVNPKKLAQKIIHIGYSPAVHLGSQGYINL